MAKGVSLPARIRPASLVKASRLRLGALEARGVPAILCGAAVLVLASGVSEALKRSASLLPETLREARAFWLALRGSRAELANGTRP
jgi:hypothetical protein